MANRGKRTSAFFHVFVKLVASTLVVSGITLGVWFYIFNKNHEETNDAQIEQYVTPIMSRITGYVEEVRYEENQFVHQGDTLVVIGDTKKKDI